MNDLPFTIRELRGQGIIRMRPPGKMLAEDVK